MKSEHRVLTPESVEFVYELAGLGARMLAVAMDHLILLLVIVALWLAMLVSGLPLLLLTGGALLGAAIIATFVIYFGYFAYFEWRWNGQTPGKRLLDLRVIDDRGMNIDLFQALMRNLFRVVDMAPFLPLSLDFITVGFYGVGGIAALLNPRGKRVGDWAAGTLVVRTRKRVMPNAIIAPNEKYNSLQENPALRRRIHGLALEERETLLQLCLRRNELEFEARQRLFAEAAAYLEQRLEIPREAFLSEEKFVQNIAAVALAEQEQRSLVRR